MIKVLTGAALAAVLHITPTVVLVKRPDAVKSLLPGAEAFFARELHLSNADRHRLHEAVDWSPEDGVLTFYAGKAGDRVTGTLTKATVETKPWVLEALRAGLVDSYKGLKPGDVPGGAASLKDRVGSLPAYMAGQVDKGVARALVSYGTFYRSAKA